MSQGSTPMYDAFAAGTKARQQGQPQTDNPYTGKLAYAWTAGWTTEERFIQRNKKIMQPDS